MRGDLRRKVVWITGGSRGLGRALALGFAGEGADISFSYCKSTEEARQTEAEVRSSGVQCKALKVDSRRVDVLRDAAQEIEETMGRIDILINNAGIFERTPLDEMTEEQFDEMFAVNLKATLFSSQEAARRMNRQGQGLILNISSIGGMIPWSNYLVYCASEAAVQMATRCLALALAPQIRVNGIAPGIITVPTDMESEIVEDLRNRIPMREFGRYDDVVEAALFLTKSGHYITGETLVVDGGRHLK